MVPADHRGPDHDLCHAARGHSRDRRPGPAPARRAESRRGEGFHRLPALEGGRGDLASETRHARRPGTLRPAPPDRPQGFPREIPADQLALPDYRPYDLGGTFEYKSAWTGRYFSLIRVLIKCAALDPEDDLRTAWKAILDHGGPEANPEAMAELLTLPVPYESAADESKALSGTPAEAAAARRRWTEAARASYLRAAELARQKGAASK